MVKNNLNKSITAIVPFLNEEKFLEESVNRLLEIDLFEEVILVDDASTDESFQIASKLSDKNTNINLIKLNKQSGKGFAVRAALDVIKTTHVIVHDADLEYFPKDIPEMFNLAVQNPGSLILGSRTIGDKKRNNKYFWTFYGNKYLTILFSLVNFYKVSDIASCYWLLETDILQSLDLKEKGFAIEVEVLSKYLKKNKKIIEVPISYDGRLFSEGKKINLRDGLLILIKIIKYSKLFSINKI